LIKEVFQVTRLTMSSGGDQTIRSYVDEEIRSFTYDLDPRSYVDEEIRSFTYDLELMLKCFGEMLVQRCVPFAALAGGLTHFAVKYGKLPAHPQFGPWPYVAAAASHGYLLGAISYLIVEEKFKADPLSEIGRQLREKEGGFHVEPSSSNSAAPEAYSAAPYRPAPPTAPSYDYIRKRNRMALGTGVLGRTPPLPPPPRRESKPELPPLNASDYDYGQQKDPIDQPSRIRRPRRRVNAYGDELEDA